MNERVPRLGQTDLDEEQLVLFRLITEGPRGRGQPSFPLVDDDGRLVGPFGLMLHAPKVGLPLQNLGSALRFRTGLGDRARELAILLVAAATRSDFEWHAHASLGREAGISPAEMDTLRSGAFSSQDPVEASLVRMCETLLDDGDVDDPTFDVLQEAVGAEQVLELIVLVGYYRTLAQMMRVFRVGTPDA